MEKGSWVEPGASHKRKHDNTQPALNKVHRKHFPDRCTVTCLASNGILSQTTEEVERATAGNSFAHVDHHSMSSHHHYLESDE